MHPPTYTIPTPTPTTPAYYPCHRLPANYHPPGCVLLIYTAVRQQPPRSQLRWTTSYSWRASFSVTPWAWNNRRKHYSKHLLRRHLPPRFPYDDGVFLPSPPRCSPSPSPSSTSLYQVFPLAIVTSCIFFPRSSCSIIGALCMFSGFTARTHATTIACQKVSLFP